MTFPEIFEQFKNHSYIRRKSWSNDINYISQTY